MNLFIYFIVFAVSPDCRDVVNLAKGLNMDMAQPVIFSQLQIDCCSGSSGTNAPPDSPYVGCEGYYVREIYWMLKGLDGTINETALPSGLYLITLSYNIGINGHMPTILPSKLAYLDLSYNSLTGSIPNSWPIGLNYLILNDNQLTGDISSIPSSIVGLYLGYTDTYSFNHFTGTLKLDGPQSLFINNNWITDVIVKDASQLSYCDISNNPLLGNPDIENLIQINCTQDGLYSANLLPNTATTVIKHAKTISNNTDSLGPSRNHN